MSEFAPPGIEKKISSPRIEVEQNKAPRFERNASLSLFFTKKVEEQYSARQIPKEQKLAPSVYVNSDALRKKGIDLPQNMDLEKFLQIAKEKGLQIDIYAGGIAWDGNLANMHEVVDNPDGKVTESNRIQNVLKKIASRTGLTDISEEHISPEEKLEQKGKLPALDFLASAGTDICITLDPMVDKKQFISSLKVDALFKKTIYEELKKLGMKPPESVNWSNGGFKEFQIHRGACDAIAQDIAHAQDNNLLTQEEWEKLTTPEKYPELLKTIQERRKIPKEVPVERDEVFTSGIDAYNYLTLLQKMNIFLGGAPAGASELATPFKLIHSTPIFREINRGLMDGANKLVKFVGKIDAKHTLGIHLYVSRSGEMARGETVDPIIEKAAEWALIQDIMQHATEGMKIVTLADQSGQVVASDRLKVGSSLEAIYGKEKAIAIESRDERDAIVETQSRNGVEQTNVLGASEHGEMKRMGVLSRLRQIVDQIRDGTFDQEKNNNERYVVIQDTNEVTLNERLIHLHTLSQKESIAA